MHLGFAISQQTDILYDTVELWLLIIGGAWGAFKSYQWVKAIREKDLRGLKLDVTALNNDLNRQTDSIVSGFSTLESSVTRELQELRSDFRSFVRPTAPIMVPVRARTMRKAPAKKKMAAKRKAK